MITRLEAERSITQLLCLIVGGQLARDTSHYSTRLTERLEACREVLDLEVQAIRDSDSEELRSRVFSVNNKKLTSIESLKKLNQLIQQID